MRVTFLRGFPHKDGRNGNIDESILKWRKKGKGAVRLTSKITLGVLPS